MKDVATESSMPIKLNIGGKVPAAGWKILNIQAADYVDYVGTCVDLSFLPNQSVEAVYASHVLEHLGYQDELGQALCEIRRILTPGGCFYISVPDLEILSKMIIHPDLNTYSRINVMRMIFGGQIDDFDFHKTGFTWDILQYFVFESGFLSLQRVNDHGLFDDTSKLNVYGHSISINAIAYA